MKKIFTSTLIILIFSILNSFTTHPYHVGSVEFRYNPVSRTFEITGRFFMDDLENAVNRKMGKHLHFQDSKYKNEMNAALQQYMEEYLKLKTNNKFLNIRYIGFEEDHESVNVYLESETVSNPKKVETAISVLYNLFDDQMNIVHIVVNGQRKSEKLSYPNRYLYQQF